MRWARTRTAGGRAACCSSGSPAPCALLRNPIVSRHFGRRWPLGVGRTGREPPWRDARCRGDASRTAPHSWAPPHARRALWHNRPRVSMSLRTMWASPPGPGRTRPISRTPPLVKSIRLDPIDHGNTPVWPVSGTPNLISSSRDWDPHVVLHSRGAGPHRRGDVLLVKSGPVGTPWAQLTTQKRPGAISAGLTIRVWCLAFMLCPLCTHTAATTPGPKTCGWVHMRPTPRISGARLGPNGRTQSAELPPTP